MMDQLFRAAKPVAPVRAVHFDLKGLPPTPQRFVKLLEICAAARYNAVCIEWEDTFPWTVDERFRCETAYTPAQVREFHAAAEKLGIAVIPLVQCLGHMETPLSLREYAPMREVPYRSDVLNPLARGARELVERMVDDVLALTPGARHFHLGGDEAWSFGTHPDTKAYIEKHGKGALYLHHVGPILDRLNARGVRPLLWHDMMRHWDDESLRRLGEKCDLVAWGYGGHPARMRDHCNTEIIQRFRDRGITVWGGAAYKGADGMDADLPNIPRREENAVGWAELGRQFGLAGIIATAWSRYATHTMQNEPIDGALDALVDVGVILHDGQPPDGGATACVAALGDLGEEERFDACHVALQQLADARRAAWAGITRAQENAVTATDDPRRRGSGQVVRLLERLRDNINAGEAAADAARRAFDGLIDRLWIDRYLNERLAPLHDELARLEKIARDLEPEIYAETYEKRA